MGIRLLSIFVLALSRLILIVSPRLLQQFSPYVFSFQVDSGLFRVLKAEIQRHLPTPNCSLHC